MLDADAAPRDDTAATPDGLVSFCRRRGTPSEKPEGALVCGKCVEKEGRAKKLEREQRERAQRAEQAEREATERREQRLTEARTLATALPPELRSLLDTAMAAGHLWGRGNPHGYGSARVHLITWVPTLNTPMPPSG